MSDTNESIVIQITQEHTPKITRDPYEDSLSVECSARDCDYDGGYASLFDGQDWAKHLLNVINDHLGLWDPDLFDEEDEDPWASGPYGDEW